MSFLFKFLIIFIIAYFMFGLFKPKQPKNTSEIDEDNVDEDKIIDDKNAIDVNICKKCNTYIVKGEKHKCK